MFCSGALMGRPGLAVALILTLTACEPRGDLRLMPQAKGIGQVETVFVATTRGPDPATGEEFGIARDSKERYVRLDISVPPVRKPGQIDWPKPDRPADPTKEFVTLAEVRYAGAPAFRADLARAIAHEKGNRREAVVFVHGFNNTFAEGAYRLAQLGHDLGVEGAMVHYSWPSRGHPLGYVYDRDSALFARDGLEQLLRDTEAANARKIIIVAHSMGGAVVMETLRQIALSGDRRLLDKIGGVVLMSPDIDVDVFRAQAQRIGKLPQPFVIFTSKKDKALALSARLTGQDDRVGNLTDPTELGDLKVTLVDTTAFSTGSGHFNAGDSPGLLAILGRIGDIESAFASDQTGRTGLIGGVVLTVQNATQIILSPVTAIANR